MQAPQKALLSAFLTIGVDPTCHMFRAIRSKILPLTEKNSDKSI
jgi:hypothetical protein